MKEDESAVPAFKLTENYRWYVLCLLVAVYTLNFLDRQLMSILMEPIKLEFGYSDTQMGILAGIAFAILYSTLGIPIARYADKHSRVKIIAISLAVWSLFTVATGLARNYWQLLAARILVGVGEAGCSPPAYSLISDYFPKNRRSTAIAIYSLGIPYGVFFGLFFGGMIAQYYGWRAAFWIAGAPGLILAAVFWLTVKRIPRGFSDPGVVALPSPPLREVFRTLWSKPSFVHLCLAAALHAVVGYGIGSFFPSYFLRAFDMQIGEVGLWLALNAAIMGGLSTFLGGWLTDKLVRRTKDERWFLRLPAISTVVLYPLTLCFLLVTTKYQAIALIALISLPSGMFWGPSAAMSQTLSPLRTRALAGSILLFITNLIGMGIGPVVVGILSDLFHKYHVQNGMTESLAITQGLLYAFLTVGLVNLWSAFHYFRACRTLREDIASVHE